MINIDIDIRNLSKWLNEEQLTGIDRQALARVLTFAYLADLDKKAIINKKDIAQPEQEPVAILNHAHGVHTVRSVKLNGLPDGEYKLYTTPQRPWVGLTDEKVVE